MPHVGPHLAVHARCGDNSDKAQAFFMKLGGRKKGSRLSDRVRLFRVNPLRTPAPDCRITIPASQGTPTEVRYCLRNGVASRC